MVTVKKLTVKEIVMNLKNLLFFFSTMMFLTSCYDYNQKASGPGANFIRTKEYAPAMYHSEPYEPLTQIKDSTGWFSSGEWSGTTKEGYGEFYNSAPHFKKTGTNVLTPVKGTIKRGSTPYHLKKEELVLAGSQLVNPITIDSAWVKKEDGDSVYQITKEGKAVFKDCKQVYTRICSHCHGKGGAGDGKVAEIYGGVPIYQSAAIKNLPSGHIFHVITHGKGRMGSHASQVSPEERWKIVTYVQYLQKQ